MTDEAVDKILQLLEEIREAIVAERSGEKDHSPPAPVPEDEKHRASDHPLSTTIGADHETSHLLTDAANEPQPPGKTFKRVRVTTVVTTKKQD